MSLFDLYQYIKRNKKVVLCDLDGTIVDSMSLHKDCYKKAFEEKGVLFDYHIWNKHACEGGSRWINLMLEQEGIPAIDWNIYVKEIKEKKYKYFFENLSDLKFNNDIVKLIKDIKSNTSIKMAIVTTAGEESAKKILVEGSLLNFFDAIFTAKDCAPNKSKPDPFLYNLAINYFAHDKKNVLALEDSSTGIKATLNAMIEVYDVINNKLIQGDY